MKPSWNELIQLIHKNKDEIKSGFLPVFKIIFAILLVLFGFYLVFGLCSMQLDNYFSVLYTQEIHPIGEKDIDSIVNEVRNISDSREKLNKIGEWEIKNFTEVFWEKTKNNTQFHFIPLDIFGRYQFDINGKFRNPISFPLPNLYANDPAWIAYYRTGACEELAVLFANVSNRSGFETRLVIADLSNPNPNPILSGIPLFDVERDKHEWVEVKIGNEWWYFDPDTFGRYYNFGDNPVRGWFNQTKYYNAFTPRQVGRVYLASTNEDVKDRYPLLKGVS